VNQKLREMLFSQRVEEEFEQKKKKHNQSNERTVKERTLKRLRPYKLNAVFIV
jgi:hypothetical protein